MAGLSFTLIGVNFAALSSANGKYALAFPKAAPIYAINRYHVQGTDGSLVNHGGLIGYRIRARVRYISTNPYASMLADTNTFKDPQPGGNIVGPDGKTYTRCLLDPDAADVIRESIAMGRGIAGQQFMDVSYQFTSDGG